LDRPSVLVARDLAPVDTAALPPEQVLALVTEQGGPTSHTAILARSLGIPAVVAVRGLLDVAGVGAHVDGDTGEVQISPEPVTARAAGPSKTVDLDGTGATADGHRVKALANVGSAVDARPAADAGAEGVGLFRTEFGNLGAEYEPEVA